MRRKIVYKSDTPKKVASGLEKKVKKIVYLNEANNTEKISLRKLNLAGLKMTKLREITKQLSNLHTILLHTNATPIGIRQGVQARHYGCAFCDETFLKPADLKSHSLLHSDDHKLNYHKNTMLPYFVARLDITGLKCKICDEKLPNLDEASEHLSKIHEKKIFATSTKRFVPFVFDTDQLSCCLCDNVFSTFKTLNTHMNKHFRNAICDICDSGFITERMLKSHVGRHNSADTGTYKCSSCDKVYTSVVNLKRHERIVHVLKGLSHGCAFCDERFAYYAQSVRHLHEKHGLEMPVYDCRACDAVFSDKKKLNRHIKKLHLMEKKHECPDCDMKFFDSEGLKHHQLKHNGKRDYKCPICLKAYGRRFTLRNHMRIHIDDRRFKCDYCDQTFVQKCSLQGHLKTRHNIVMESQEIVAQPSKPLSINALLNLDK